MSAALRRIPSTTIFSCRWPPRRCIHAASPLSAQARPSNKDASSMGRNSAQMVSVEPADAGSRKTRRKTKKNDDGTTPTNTVQQHLDRFMEINPLGSVALEDIERYRIPSESEDLDPRSPDYEQFSEETVKRLTQSFSLPQLRQFIELYGLVVPQQRTKAVLARFIMEEQWKYPSLEKVKQDRIDWTEQEDLQVPIDPSHSFLLIGKDGQNIFELSRRYDVYLAFSANPMSIRIKGLKGSVKKIQGYLSTFKKDIELSTFYLSVKHRISAETEQTISRLSGAYVKMADNFKISISYLRSKPETLTFAKRLVTEAASARIPSFAQAIYFPDGDASSSPHSLYPFAALHPLPWQIRSNSTFRYRRVGNWSEAFHSPDPETTKRLPSTLGSMFMDNNTEIDLKTFISTLFGTSGTKTRSQVVTASPGHFLFSQSAGQHSNITPPLSGALGAREIFHWIKDNYNQVQFSPSVPRFVAQTAPQKEREIDRLVYNSHEPQNSNDSSLPVAIVTLEMPRASKSGQGLSTDEFPEPFSQSNESTITAGSVINVDLLVPDRQTDLRISLDNGEKVSTSKWPKELKRLVSPSSSTSDSPEIPLSITYSGRTYLLHSHHHVKQALRGITFTDVENVEGLFLTEDVVDLESGESSTSCKLICDDHTNDSVWTNFLRICSLLTSPH